MEAGVKMLTTGYSVIYINFKDTFYSAHLWSSFYKAYLNI